MIVETTGLADPAPIVNALIPGSIPASSLRDQTVAAHFRLARVVACFDALTGECALDRAFEAVKQIAFADTIVITKTDLAERQGLSRNFSHARVRLSATNPFAEIVDRADLRFADLFHGAYLEADRVGDVSGWLALDRILRTQTSQSETTGSSAYAHDVRAIPLVCGGTITREKLSLFLRMLLCTAGAQVLRVKGLVAIAGDSDRPTAIHATHHIIHPSVQLAQWPERDRRNRLVIIGRGLDEKAVEQVFRALSQSDAAIALSRPRPFRPLALAAALSALVILGILVVHLSQSRVETASDRSGSSSREDRP